MSDLDRLRAASDDIQKALEASARLQAEPGMDERDEDAVMRSTGAQGAVDDAAMRKDGGRRAQSAMAGMGPQGRPDGSASRSLSLLFWLLGRRVFREQS